MLYFIRHKTQPQEGYLFGTMHLASDEAYTFATQAQRALNDCTCFAAEIDFSDENLISLNSLFDLPSGQRLSDFYSDKRYAKMKRILHKSFDANLDDFTHKMPFYVSNYLLTTVAEKVHRHNLDYFLYLKAVERNLSICGLETLDDQVEIVRGLDLQVQAKGLKDLARYPKKYRKKSRALFHAYRDNDVRKIHRLGRDQLGSFREILLKTRNFRMAEAMATMLGREARVFAAVGAGHLSGKSGLLSLLKNRGYVIRAVI